MKTALERLFLHTVRGLIYTYPPRFRSRFGAEMMQVYSMHVLQVGREAGALGLIRLWVSMVCDGALSALAQWGSHWSRQITKVRMAMKELDRFDSSNGNAPLSVTETLLGVLPFLLYGAANVLVNLNLVPYSEGTSMGFFLATHPYPIFYALMLLGLAAGVLAGMPRWAYSYLGWAGLSAFWFYNVSVNDQSMSFLCIPLPLMIILPLFIRWLKQRKLHPMKLVLPGPWHDMNLLPLALYIFHVALYVMYDENQHPAVIWFIAASGLAAGLGAWGFFRAASPLRRVVSLIGGLAVIIALEIWNSLTWDFGAYHGIQEPSSFDARGLIFFVALFILMLGIGGLEEVKRREAAAS